MLTIGDLRIHLINDCTTYVDPGGAFGLVPRALWSRIVAPTADHLVPMVNLCLLVETAGRRVLIDTGFGHKWTDKQRAMWVMDRSRGDLIDALARLGVAPGDINLVVNTHLHSDHCSGNTRYDESGALAPTFPNAEYVAQRREYEDAMRPNERTAATYLPVNYAPLVERGQMRLLNGDPHDSDGVELAPGVFGVVTPGHTPGHMSVRFASGGAHGLYTCDLATYAVHFERLGWMTAYDVEPLRTLETKRRWTRWALDHDALLIFAHDSARPVGRLREEADGKRALEALPFEFA
jgi:glyoxylase-like metal-dependent hydrolase (beta-lactamase superfamily II)